MVGRRLADAEWPDGWPVPFDEMRDGDYWFVHGCPEQNGGFDGCWWLYYHGPAMIPRHFVVEHDDGTISVPQPGQQGAPAGEFNSVLIDGRKRDDPPAWHGYIHHGVWCPC